MLNVFHITHLFAKENCKYHISLPSSSEDQQLTETTAMNLFYQDFPSMSIVCSTLQYEDADIIMLLK